jgi:hypothetical protein
MSVGSRGGVGAVGVLRLFGGAARLGSCHLEGDLSWKRKKEKKEKSPSQV